MTAPTDSKLATLAIHAGQEPDPTTGAIMTPIFQTSTYIQDGPGKHRGYEYSRTANPTRTALEANIAALENAQHGFAFASGCAATANVIMCLDAGDHVVVSDDLYGGTSRLFRQVFARLGIEFSFVDLTQAAALTSAIQPNTKLVWVETPTNPMLKLTEPQLSSLSDSGGHGASASAATRAAPPLPRICDPVLLAEFSWNSIA